MWFGGASTAFQIRIKRNRINCNLFILFINQFGCNYCFGAAVPAAPLRVLPTGTSETGGVGLLVFPVAFDIDNGIGC